MFAGLDLELVIGGLLLFGPRRAEYVLVRQVMVSTGSGQAAAAGGGGLRDAGTAASSETGAGAPHHPRPAGRAPTRWAGRSGRSAPAPAELPVTVRQARRWDGDRRVAWRPDAPHECGSATHIRCGRNGPLRELACSVMTQTTTQVRGPARSDERALAPDLARGFMLLMIVLANTPWYLYGKTHGLSAIHPDEGSALDRAVQY